MKVVASVQDLKGVEQASSLGVSAIELRLDLMAGDREAGVRAIRNITAIPLIATLRSSVEGGRFGGSSREWWSVIDPLVEDVEMVDVEMRYRDHVPVLKSRGVEIIASFHTQAMPSEADLVEIEQNLRSYGDIPKIAVRPRTLEDVLSLFEFTLQAEKPIVIVVMGGAFRFARPVCALLGSEFQFCHVGSPTAEGQYSVEEYRMLLEMLR
jgi:3-dehydroquinate dehydratase-1